MIIADIGNRHIHICINDEVLHLDLKSALERFSHKKNLIFISVNKKASNEIKFLTDWRDVSELIKIDGEYKGMGVDRKALCLSQGDGIYIDAGSAITIDKIKNGRYIGGMIFPGLYSYSKIYKTISPKLSFNIDEVESFNLFDKSLPKGTKNQLIYTVFKPMINSIESIKEDLPVYITGGDKNLIGKFVKDAYLSDKFIFKGIAKALKINLDKKEENRDKDYKYK